jgi:hypothetical protein
MLWLDGRLGSRAGVWRSGHRSARRSACRPLVGFHADPLGGELPRRLQHPFKVIAFDWDGTAVATRRDDATPLCDVLTRLLRLDIPVVIITGTSFSNIDRQLVAAIRGLHKRHLYVSSNRGSEVYGFDARSRPLLLWRRMASREEDHRLTAIIEALCEVIVAKTRLDVRVIYERLNRRKIDPPGAAAAGLEGGFGRHA